MTCWLFPNWPFFFFLPFWQRNLILADGGIDFFLNSYRPLNTLHPKMETKMKSDDH